MSVSDTERVIADRRATAMGSGVHVIVVGDGSEVFAASSDSLGRIDELERRWSRFRPDSEISRLNTAHGDPIEMSADSITLVDELVRAWRLSGGAFDPGIGRSLSALGYDRSYSDMTPQVPVRARRDAEATSPGFDVEIDHEAMRVQLPAGMTLDPGGLGKGLAADLVVGELLDLPGIEGALVSIGGDLRCEGLGPHGSGWAIEVGDDIAGVPDEVLVLDSGGIATSTPARRRWRTESGWAHHLIDPRTRRPASDPPAAVTVVAARATDAEWIATAIASGASELLFRLDGDFTVIVTGEDGRRLEHGPIGELLP